MGGLGMNEKLHHFLHHVKNERKLLKSQFEIKIPLIEGESIFYNFVVFIICISLSTRVFSILLSNFNRLH
jgi:hypothetical protein